ANAMELEMAGGQPGGGAGAASSTPAAAATPAASWVQAPVPPAAHLLVDAGYPRALALLLSRRGGADAAQAERFLRPSLEQLHDGAMFAGMSEALALLAGVRERGQSVAIVGDYDVDGVSATALLLASLRACGIAAEAILPHRLQDGYGLQEPHV